MRLFVVLLILGVVMIPGPLVFQGFTRYLFSGFVGMIFVAAVLIWRKSKA